MQLGLSALLALFAATATVSASPLAKRDIWSPPITSPDATTVWEAGQVVQVTWDTANPPEVFPDGGQITLKNFNTALFDDTVFNVVVKEGFSLTDGSAEITVPSNIPTDDQYFITLFGDSGNTSPNFRIEGN
ncbi:hypothetical protein AAF712_012574 [Marasmius tenuissimus]|uniref:Yeast cell wall synthesis Kre9/Knh1-like N-terminal domain-containing protein n=1 Tax=Marasmius tenuissimus TaxID=585030 RepID=A0ABR2ZI36_9AGAR